MTNWVPRIHVSQSTHMEATMRATILWLLGVPLGIVVLLVLFGII